MKLNADFTCRAIVHADAVEWVASPIAGVWRKMLDRLGAEVARATSIVRYDPGSRFSRHVHGGGEEFLVLDGVFEDEHGSYPAGSYLRNPPQSAHTPGAAAGCVILVKLWQFDADDRSPVRLHVDHVAPVAVAARPHVRLQCLHRGAREDVRIETWAPDQAITLKPLGGIEVFVLDGSFNQGGDQLRLWSWLRLPVDACLDAVTGPDGARVWIKEGHLRFL